jgi:hypothetical protein
MKRDDHQGGEAATLSSRRTTTTTITNRLETLVAAWGIGSACCMLTVAAPTINTGDPKGIRSKGRGHECVEESRDIGKRTRAAIHLADNNGERHTA